MYQTGGHLICPQEKPAPTLSQGSWSLLRAPVSALSSLSYAVTGQVFPSPGRLLGGWLGCQGDAVLALIWVGGGLFLLFLPH